MDNEFKQVQEGQTMFEYKYVDLMNSTLKAIKELGGSASND